MGHLRALSAGQGHNRLILQRDVQAVCAVLQEASSFRSEGPLDPVHAESVTADRPLDERVEQRMEIPARILPLFKASTDLRQKIVLSETDREGPTRARQKLIYECSPAT